MDINELESMWPKVDEKRRAGVLLRWQRTQKRVAELVEAGKVSPNHFLIKLCADMVAFTQRATLPSAITFAEQAFTNLEAADRARCKPC